MDYLNFVISEIHGLRVKEALGARKEGREVVGSFCLYVPEELVLAVDGIAVGLCAVFAESEVVGLVTRGEHPQDIARAVHHSVARRSAAMLQRVGADPPVFFAGGAALNTCLVAMLSEALGTEVFVPPDPQLVGALGAALLAAETAQHT